MILLTDDQQPGAGGSILYKPYRYVPPQRVWKTGTHFAHFGLESGMVLERNTGMYERNYRICEFEVLLEKFFVCALI